jgi:hypothetical protein
MAIPLPALGVRPPEAPDLLSQYQKLVSLKSLMGEQAMIPEEAQELALRNRLLGAQDQQAQLNLQQQQATMNVLRGWDPAAAAAKTSGAAPAPQPVLTGDQLGSAQFNANVSPAPQAGASVPESGTAAPPGLYEQLSQRILAAPGTGAYGAALSRNLMALNKNYIDVQNTQMNMRKTQADLYRNGLLAAANGASMVLNSVDPKTGLPDPLVVGHALDIIGAQNPQEAAKLRAGYQQNPASILGAMRGFRAYSAEQLNALTRQQLAQTTAARLNATLTHNANTEALMADRNRIERLRAEAEAAKAAKGSKPRIGSPQQFSEVDKWKATGLARAEAAFTARVRANPDDRADAEQELAGRKQQIQDTYEDRVRDLGGTPSHYEYAQPSAPAAQPSLLGRVEGAIAGKPAQGAGKAAAGKPLDAATAMRILQQAGGDRNRARTMARQMGYSF